MPTNALAGIQVVEYLRAFLFGRLGWNRLGGNIIISGAFGLFRRESVLNAGGYLHDTVGEDMELVLRLKRLSYERPGPGKIAFVPDPVAWTEVPESLKSAGAPEGSLASRTGGRAVAAPGDAVQPAIWSDRAGRSPLLRLRRAVGAGHRSGRTGRVWCSVSFTAWSTGALPRSSI